MTTNQLGRGVLRFCTRTSTHFASICPRGIFPGKLVGCWDFQSFSVCGFFRGYMYDSPGYICFYYTTMGHSYSYI